jgi:aerobic carbon-monoxide dehydrogenase small subunit
MANEVAVTMKVNGVQHQASVEPRLLLVHFLRETLGLTGTHVGCDTSQCGACAVLLDGAAVKSCTLLAAQADGAEITTIEGLATDGAMHPLQEAFWACHGLQCGFCTPGMVIASYDLLQHTPKPSDDEIRRALDGNFCRCTGYHNIVAAVRQAADRIAKP